jgi:hypothetical protein
LELNQEKRFMFFLGRVCEWAVITEIVEKAEAEILKIKNNLLTAG